MDLFRNRYRLRNFGLLILRLGIGLMFVFHGWPKLDAGPERWTALGQNMQLLGLSFAPMFWGFMAGFVETAGGVFFALGLFFRPTCMLLLFTMVVATARHAVAGDGFGGYSHALEAAILFFALIFIGPGKYSLDEKFFPSHRDRTIF